MGERADGGEGGRKQPGKGPISLQRGFDPGWLSPAPPSRVPRICFLTYRRGLFPRR